jgi:hypothetical protein
MCAIFGRRPAPGPWPPTRSLVATAVEVLPTIADDLAADLLEHLARALVGKDEELRAARALQSEALTLLHAQHAENVRLRRRVADLLAACRRARAAAA